MIERAVVLYRPDPTPEKQHLAGDLYPQHLALYQRFADAGRVVSFGPWKDMALGSMALFSSVEDAESFVAEDPFVEHGVVADREIRVWLDMSTPAA